MFQVFDTVVILNWVIGGGFQRQVFKMIKNWCLNGQKIFAGKWSNFPRKQVIINIFVKWNWIFRNISAARIITIYIYFNKVVVRQLVDRLISVSRKKWPFLVFFQSFFRCFWTFFGIFWLSNLKIRPKPRIHKLHTPLISRSTRTNQCTTTVQLIIWFYLF